MALLAVLVVLLGTLLTPREAQARTKGERGDNGGSVIDSVGQTLGDVTGPIQRGLGAQNSHGAQQGVNDLLAGEPQGGRGNNPAGGSQHERGAADLGNSILGNNGAIEPASQTLNDISGLIGNQSGNANEPVSQMLKGAAKPAEKALEGVTKGTGSIGYVAQPVEQALIQDTGSVKQPLSGVVEPVRGEDVRRDAQPVEKMVGALSKPADQVLGSVPQPVDQMLKTAPKPVKKPTSGVSEPAGQVLSNVVGPIGKELQGVAGPLGETVRGITKNNAPVGQVLGGITEQTSHTLGAVTKPVRLVSAPILQPVETSLGKTTMLLGETVQPVLKPIGKTVNSVLKPLGNIGSLLPELANVTVSSALKSLGGVVGLISGGPPVHETVSRPGIKLIKEAVTPVPEPISRGSPPIRESLPIIGSPIRIGELPLLQDRESLVPSLNFDRSDTATSGKPAFEPVSEALSLGSGSALAASAGLLEGSFRPHWAEDQGLGQRAFSESLELYSYSKLVRPLATGHFRFGLGEIKDEARSGTPQFFDTPPLSSSTLPVDSALFGSSSSGSSVGPLLLLGVLALLLIALLREARLLALCNVPKPGSSLRPVPERPG